jgi:hypothetical protein
VTAVAGKPKMPRI